jgi:hypothetical protein
MKRLGVLSTVGVAIVALLVLAGALSGRSILQDDALAGEKPEFGMCSHVDIESFCAVITQGMCTNGAYYLGRDALEKNYLAEASVKPKDGNELFPKYWEIKHAGQFVDYGIQCGLTVKDHHKTLLEIPVEKHCSAQHITSGHHYIWFFSSSPETDCVAVAECVCY